MSYSVRGRAQGDYCCKKNVHVNAVTPGFRVECKALSSILIPNVLFYRCIAVSLIGHVVKNNGHSECLHY